MNDSQQTVVTSFAVVGLSVYLGALSSGGRPTIRPIVGIVVAGSIMLAAVQSPSLEPIARRFSVLVATTAVLTSGFYVARALGNYFGRESVPTTVPAAAGSASTGFRS